MSKPLVYLAGPITGLTYDGATEWRKTAASILKQHGISSASPLRAKEHLGMVGELKNQGYKDPLTCDRGITTRDRFDCTRCDVVLVNLIGADRVSIGTVMEIAWADLKRIPVVVAMEADNPHSHAMLNEAVGFVVNNLKDALHVVIAILEVD